MFANSNKVCYIINRGVFMNNRGFTLIEILLVISLISFITIVLFFVTENTLSLTNQKAYEIFERNIITQTENYILECENNLINCDNDYYWEDFSNGKKTSFYLDVMKKYNYFSEEEFLDPNTKKDVSDCLLIEVYKDNLSSLKIDINNKKC